MNNATTLTNDELEKVMRRYEYLVSLRDDAGSSEGEKVNCQVAIDNLLRKHGLSDSEMQERLGRKATAEEFFLGDDAPHMARYKRALMTVIANTGRVKMMRFQNGLSLVLIGQRDRVSQATELFLHVYRSVNAEAALRWEMRSIKFGDSADEKKPGWIHSFREGALLSVRDRLMARMQEEIQKEAEYRNVSADILRQEEENAMKDILDDLLNDPDIKKRMEEINKRMQEQQEEKRKQEKAADEAAGIIYNEFGFQAGRLFGKVLTLQAEIAR